MPIVLDEQLRQQYFAQAVASTRASVVVSSLSAPVTIEVRDGANGLRASGTMATPWATSSGGTIGVGQVNSSGLTVVNGGVPQANWYCQFKGANGRFVRGSFGITGSGQDFVWSLPTFTTGSRGTLSSVVLTAAGTADVPVVIAPAAAIAPDLVRLSFKPQSNLPDWQLGGWEVYRSTNGGPLALIDTQWYNAGEYLDLEPIPGATHTYRIKQTNDPLFLEATVVVPTAYTVPAPVTGVLVTKVTATTCAVSWTSPQDNSETFFRIQCDDGVGVWRELCRPASRTSVLGRVVGLKGGVANQRIRVIAENPAGASVEALSAVFSTPAYSGVVPGAPTNLTAVAGESTRVSVEFKLADLNAEGSVVEVSSDGGTTWAQKTILGKYSWKCWVIELAALTTYSIRVRAFGAGGVSAYSNVATVTTMAPGQVLSPTGRTPRLWWTPHIHQRWMSWKAEYEANPTNPTTLGARSWEILLKPEKSPYKRHYCAAILYQATGNVSYIPAAYKVDNEIPLKATTELLNLNPGGVDTKNAMREDGIFIAGFSEWIYPGLAGEEKAYVDRAVRNMVRYTLSRRNGPFINPGDSDQLQGQYWSLAMTASAFHPSMPSAYHAPNADYWYAYAKPERRKIGGFAGVENILTDAPTGFETLRDQMERYFSTVGEDGAWFESSEYNVGTMQLALLGLEGFRTSRSYYGDNCEYFWRFYTKWAVNSGIAQTYHITPDFNDIIHWGDDEDGLGVYPHRGLRSASISMFGLAAGISMGVADIGVKSHQALNNDWAEAKLRPTAREHFWLAERRFLIPFETSMLSGGRNTFPKYTHLRGVGQTHHFDAWNSSGSMFWHQGAPDYAVDHNTYAHSNVLLYRKGIWTFYGPIGYSTPFAAPQLANTVSFAGTTIGGLDYVPHVANRDPNIFGSKAAEVVEQSDERTYIRFAQYGCHFGVINISYPKPPPFVHETTRGIFYLPSVSQTSDVIVQMERAYVSNPKLMPLYDAYGVSYPNPSHQYMANGLFTLKRIFETPKLAQALFQWHWVTSSAPTKTATEMTWTTANGQLCKAEHLFPTSNLVSETYAIADPTWEFKLTTKPEFSTTLYSSVDAWPTDATPRYYRMLNVISARDSGASVSSALIQSSTGHSVMGARITRTPENDVVVLFNAMAPTGSGSTTVRNRLIVSGFTVAYTQATSVATVYVNDLAVSKTWTVSVDGGSPQALTVSSTGCAQFTTSGAGAKTLVFA